MNRIVGWLLLALPLLAAAQHRLDLTLDPAAGSLELRQHLPWNGAPTLDLALIAGLELTSLHADGEALAVARRGQHWQAAVPSTTETLTLVVSGRPAGVEETDSPFGPDRPVIRPEGSFLPSSGWLAWPVPAPYRLSVTVPAPQRAVATGELLEEITADTTYRAVFARERPGGPPVVLAGPYTVRERHDAGVRLRSYFHPELNDQAGPYLDAAGDYIRRFSERIGAYPFADFHMVSAPWPVGLGFPNLSYISRRIVPLPYMRGRSLAHEILHNWWGNGVYVDYGRGNWAEGLTTYMADYALAADAGPAAARALRLEWLRDFAALPADRDMPLRAFTSRHHEAAHMVGYRKGAFVFHMLQRRLGKAHFDAVMGHFWRTQQFRVAGWDALQASAEQVSGQDLTVFFQQWLERRGAPALRLEAATRESIDGAHRLSLTLAQETPAYRLRVPVVVETASGVESFEAALQQPRQSFQWVLDSAPRVLAVDPDFQVFRRLDPLEGPPILRDVTLAARPAVVLLEPAMEAAAHALAARLLDGEPRWVDEAGAGAGPLLLIGSEPSVQAAARRLGLSGPPEELPTSATARVWTERREDGAVALVVSARDRDALAALLGPLPHYGRRSYLAFQGSRAVITGTWEGEGGFLRRRWSDPVRAADG